MDEDEKYNRKLGAGLYTLQVKKIVASLFMYLSSLLRAHYHLTSLAFLSSFLFLPDPAVDSCYPGSSLDL